MLNAERNVLPFITQAATGRRGPVTVFGDDYDTVDGTGVRDYLHVMDVAAGHRSALARTDLTGYRPINLGTGVGTSVLQLISTFEAVSGLRVPFVIGPRRAGDVATLVADAALARELLGWTAARTITDACHDAWKFAAAHPSGYALDRPMARL